MGPFHLLPSARLARIPITYTQQPTHTFLSHRPVPTLVNFQILMLSHCTCWICILSFKCYCSSLSDNVLCKHIHLFKVFLQSVSGTLPPLHSCRNLHLKRSVHSVLNSVRMEWHSIHLCISFNRPWSPDPKYSASPTLFHITS